MGSGREVEELASRGSSSLRIKRGSLPSSCASYCFFLCCTQDATQFGGCGVCGICFTTALGASNGKGMKSQIGKGVRAHQISWGLYNVSVSLLRGQIDILSDIASFTQLLSAAFYSLGKATL